jgi:hypothetical protein
MEAYDFLLSTEILESLRMSGSILLGDMIKFNLIN